MPPEPRKIIWQKWVNPLTGRGEEDRVNEYKEDPLAPPAYKEPDPIQDAIDSATKTIDPEDLKLGPHFVGPMGVIPLREHADPAVVYDFWLAHTNFLITHEVEAVGSYVPGVEGWDTFSPYRARIAFGKAFERSKVMKAIQDALQANQPAPAAVKKKPEPTANHGAALAAICKQLAKTHPAWAIVREGNGRLAVFYGTSSEEVKKQLPAGASPLRSSWEKQ